MRKFITCISIIAVLAAGACVSANPLDEIRSASGNFRDLSASIVVTYANKPELMKIDKGFAQSYEFKSASLLFKYPNKVKFSGKVGLLRVDYIVSGDDQIIRVPTLHLTRKDNFADAPQRRQTPLDVGVLSDAIWNDFNVQLEGDKTVDGRKQYVLFLKRKDKPRTQRLWVDAETMRLETREKYEKDGRLEVRFEYSSCHKLDSVWVPGKISVYSGSGKLAGVTEYHDIKVNTGVSDSEFR